ncbi:MAG: hypothetical protein IH991_16925 [Planctomycetes bacterium]|nr:hypothetical protein [Planctomycetota bacterium]
MAESSVRLATAKRINRGRDDPAGLIAYGQLEREFNDLQKLSESADRARRTARAADGGLSLVNDLLNRVRGNVVEATSSTTSAEQRNALQIEIDAALDAVDLIRNITRSSGQRLLDGTATIRVGTSDAAALSLPNVSSTSLGGASGSLNDLRSGDDASLAKDSAAAFEIVNDAQDQVSNFRAEIGAFERATIDSTKEIALRTSENIAQAKSQIGDTDFSTEIVNLIKAEMSAKATFAALRTILDTEKGMLGALFDTIR